MQATRFGIMHTFRGRDELISSDKKKEMQNLVLLAVVISRHDRCDERKAGSSYHSIVHVSMWTP